MGVTLPDGREGQPGKCRSCGAEILWSLTKAGKRCPYDWDGVSHFATCKDARLWTKRPAKGAR